MGNNKAIRWYNKLSLVHDLLSYGDWPYKEARKEAVNALDLQENDCVIDLFCGTGVNFGHILNHVGNDGRIIGIDGSTGMLAHARKRIQKEGWHQDQITLLEQDLLYLTPEIGETISPIGYVPKVLITLALGVLPNYEAVFTNIFNLMPMGTRFVILEGYCEEGARGAWLLDFIGHSDCRRRVWEPIKALTTDYQETWHTPGFKFIKGSLIVASGMKTN